MFVQMSLLKSQQNEQGVEDKTRKNVCSKTK